MKTLELSAFGLEHLTLKTEASPTPTPAAGEVLVNMQAASINARDCQIALGEFSSDVSFPLVPLSDGAGQVAAVGNGVTDLAVGDLVTPAFFPNWQQGEALGTQRAVSLGLERPGVAQTHFRCAANSLVKAAPHLNAAEAACFPCAGVTAWSALEIAGITQHTDPWVLVQGTGGVATLGILLAKAMGARVMVISGDDGRLQRALALGADAGFNYRTDQDWGEKAYQQSGHGVDLVLETGGTGTITQSLNAIRHGGHIAIIGYMDGVDLGTTVFPLIIKNAHLHGLGVGPRRAHQRMMDFIAVHQIRPVISKHYPLEDTAIAMRDLLNGGHVGKLVVDF